MRLTVPDYYASFRCIAGDCRHSCCVGWEIDIDEETRALYESMPGEIGVRVRESLMTAADGSTCFRLAAGERCPHLNADGLCDIILAAGEEYLSQICDDHPRYRSYFTDHIELGLGLSCEEAARLALSWEPRVTYITVEDDGAREALTAFEETILATRAACLAVAQDRTLPFAERLEKLAAMAKLALPSISAWAKHLATLERLNSAWDSCLAALREYEEKPGCIGTAPTEAPMKIALEQFLVYLLYRHLPNAEDTQSLSLYIAFVVMSCRTIMTLAEDTEKTGIAQLAEYVRLWSSEIEYSTENIEVSLDYLSAYQPK